MTGFDLFVLAVLAGGLVCSGLAMIGAIVPAAVVAVLAGLLALIGITQNTGERVDRRYFKPTIRKYFRDGNGWRCEVLPNPHYKPKLKLYLAMAGALAGLVGLLVLVVML